MKTNEESILRKIDDSTGFEIALLTTYNFEIPFFEQYILPLLTKNSIKTINLFVDSEQLNQALSRNSSFHLGRKYFVTPIRINGAFHPKVILLIGEKKAKLIISSANIKLSGYMHNNEVFNSFDYSEDKVQYAGLIRSAISFFKDLISISAVKDTAVVQRLNDYSITSEGDDSVSLLFNTQTPIIQQLFTGIEETIERINIAVPFYDRSLDGLREIIKRSGCENVHLYIQNKTNTFPREYNQSSHIVSEELFHIFKTVKSKANTKSFFHGKVIELVSTQHSYIFYGSANCTSNALLRTYRQNGNIECGVLIQNDMNANTEFFNRFVLIGNDKFEGGFSIEAEAVPQNYSFIYGEISDDSIILHFSYDKKRKLCLLYYGQELETMYSGEELIAILPKDILVNEKSTFDVELRFDETAINLTCWYNDPRILMLNRMKNVEPVLKDLQTDNDMSKYQEYIEKLFEAMAMNSNWYTNSKKMISRAPVVENPDNQDEDEVSDGFILDQDIDETYLEHSLDYSIYKNSSTLSLRFFRSLTKHDIRPHIPGSRLKVLEYPVTAEKERFAMPSEKRLGRILKRHINSFFQQEKNEDLPYEQCTTVFGTFADLIERVVYRDKVKGFLDLNYIIEAKTQFAKIIVKKARAIPDYDDIDNLINYVLKILIEREYRGFGKKGDHTAEHLIYDLNAMKPIRDNVAAVIQNLDLSLIVDEKKKIDSIYKFAYDYIDSLFGYKTKNQLVDFLKRLYSADVELYVANEVQIKVTMPFNNFPIEGLINNSIEEINSFISGYNYSVSRILIWFIDPKSNYYIKYNMRTNKTNVYKVRKEQYTHNSHYSCECRLLNDIWRIKPGTIKQL